jgi:hypothetical protein
VATLDNWLTGWLTGWLIGWLADWLTDWLAGWLIDWLTGWLIVCLDDWLTDCGTRYVRAAVTPQWGGKIWSMYDKKAQKDMVFNNPAHQPDNIGYRKAWTSGGSEWNWGPGYIGHSVFTESPTWTAIINTSKGDVVRVWEYDRLNRTTWQVDMLLDGPTLWYVRSRLFCSSPPFAVLLLSATTKKLFLFSSGTVQQLNLALAVPPHTHVHTHLLDHHQEYKL